MADYSFSPVKSDIRLQTPASTVEMMSASVGRLKDPLVYGFSAANAMIDGLPDQEFDRTLDPIFNPVKEQLMELKTEGEFKAAQLLYLKDLADRKAFQNATMGQVIVGEVANPIGWIPIVRAFKGASMLASGANLGITAGGITATEEAARASTLVGYDPVEGAFNIGASTLMGFGFGAGLYSGKVAINNFRDRAHTRLHEHQQTIAEFEYFNKNEKSLAATLKSNRKFTEESDDALRSKAVGIMKSSIPSLERTIEKARKGEIGEDGFHRDNIIASSEKQIRIFLAKRKEYLEELTKRRLDRGASSLDDPFQIASSLFDYVDIMPTPATTIYKYKIPLNVPEGYRKAVLAMKKATASLADDGSILFDGHRMGMTLDRSVDTLNKMRKANVYTYESKLTSIWREETGASKIGGNLTRQITKSGPTRDEWLDHVVRKYIREDASMTPKEKEAGELFFKFFDDFKRESEGLGTLGSKRHIEGRISYSNLRMEYIQSKLDQATEKQQATSIEYWQGRVKEVESEIAELQASLEYIEFNVLKPIGAKEPYWHRQWDKEVIIRDEAGPQELRRVLTNWVRENPTGVEYDKKSGLFKAKDFTGDLEGQDRYVDEVIKAIVSDNDAADVSATARSTRLPSRSVSIPNALVLDFINTNAFDVLRKYSQRAGGKNDFARVFGNKIFKQVADELVDDLIGNGETLENANMLRKNFTILYQRVTATTLSDPTSLTNKTVQFLKEFTSLNYLGSAGVTAIGDVPKLIMENGFKNVFKGILASFDDPNWQKQLGEVKSVYAEALELSLGTTQQRILEDTGVTTGSKVWNGVKDAGFILNGLGPMTVGLKSLSGSLSVHNFVEIAKRVADESASKFDLEYMSRYGLSVDMMKEIATKAPVQQTGQKLYVANIGDWSNAGIRASTIAQFQAAVSKTVANTVLSSTPTTRFTYADGSIFVPIKWARSVMPNVEEAKDFQGYVRWESGVMTMPFQFYNYSMSAASNILRTTAQGQTRHRYGGFALMLGIGYMMAKIRTPDWAWEEMDFDQKFTAAVERSGIGSIYADVALNSIRIGTQLGLNDPDNDMVRLPFYGKDGFAEAATTLLGAGSSTIKDAVDAGIKFGEGEYGDAMKEFYLMLPLTELFWMKEDSRAMIDYATKSIFENR